MKAIVLTLVAALALVVVGAVGLIHAGAINFAADEPHSPMIAKAIEIARERFIGGRAKAIQVPDLSSQERIATGAQHYAPMCAGCHLAPGAKNTELRQGLYPQPPELARPDNAGDPARQFWVIKHGIKGSGMPAWGTSHDDAAIWALVAFAQKLPTMSPEQYQALTAPPVKGDGHSHTHSH
ncbi:MAG: c-type cytochrome [Gammaproteobacteria bacterium]